MGEGKQLADHASAPAPSAENRDLDFIANLPGGGVAAGVGDVSAAHSATDSTFYIEDAGTYNSFGRVAFPLPTGFPSTGWENRTSLDGRYYFNLTPTLSGTVSDRFNVIEQHGVTFPSDNSFRNDFREGYLSWQALPQTFFEAGRINVKEGAALGFNPTDFFKTRTLVDQSSQDPAVLRDDRLGTAMVRAQEITDTAAFSLSFAPKLTSPSSPLYDFNNTLHGGFGRTNGTDRLLVSGSYNLGNDWDPQLLYYREGDVNKFGANISHGIGQSVIVYAEWAGGMQASMLHSLAQAGEQQAAKMYGDEVIALLSHIPSSISPFYQDVTFKNQVAVGGSWTPVPNLTFNLEYHYNEAGLSGQDWNNLSTLDRKAPRVANEVWEVLNGYALDEQAPLAQQEVFVRANLTNAFINHLDLSAFAYVNLYNGSTTTQLAATYLLSDQWTLSGLVGGNIGGPLSDHSTVVNDESATLKVAHYF